ncbi:MAG: cysteine desulfurase [Ruminococcaceae bacterium]|nr:cysteine desulfurase [Oscillospiraceae bacterium]
MKEIYLDNSATTPLCEGAIEAMGRAMRTYGNPSSLHTMGHEAQKLVDAAREGIGSALGVRMMKPGELIFTSCGTEANNLAIFGVAYAKARRVANKIVTTDSEHPSVEKSLRMLEADGFEVVRISTRGGVLNFEQLENALDEKVLLLTMMMVNNETGAAYDLSRVFRLAKERCPSAVTHCDAVQGFLKLRFSPTAIGADLVSISAHKIHGPKGVGALYVNREILKQKKLAPRLFGGGQEFGFRSGTENVIGIVGFGAAVRETGRGLDEKLQRMASLREYALLKLSALDVTLNVPIGDCAPHILNFTLPRIKSETMLHYLSGEGIYVSSGSACSSHSHAPSPTLLAFGLSPSDAENSIRVSLSEYNTEEEIDRFVECLKNGLGVLVRVRK